MNIVWLSWKDRKNPLAGGAELVNEALARQLVAHGHKVKLIVAGFSGGKSKETIDGYEVIRVGGRVSVYFQAWRYYVREDLADWADLVIDEVNTVPFFAKFYAGKPNILLAYMLCREIWFYELAFPLSLLGWLVEPLYLRLLGDRKVLTESQSTKNDLIKHGFKAANISIFPVCSDAQPLLRSTLVKKYPKPTILSFGALKPMKRTLHIVQAFELAKAKSPELKLIVAGRLEGQYGAKVLRTCRNSKYARDIKCLGQVTTAKRTELMQKSHLIAVTSVKEGWGLIVSEAASQGTPAVVYNVDGLRDSVKDGKTGLITKENTPAALAAKMLRLLENKARYDTMRISAWKASQRLTAENSYQAFRKVIEGVR